MNAACILETLTAAGVTLRRSGDRVKLIPATGTVPADVVELARKHKPELLALLPDLPAQRRRLTAAAIAQYIPAEIIDALDDLDIDGCQWLDEPGLRGYAQILQENYLRAHGVTPLRPVRWDTAQTVTCATCMHQLRRPDTSDAGMHGCAKGHSLHYAREQHACADWKPRP